ncbi:HAD family hydrolase [Paenibacillus sp. EC2-1]|uniref:HAD family hydrolase n=1 Tax=Paenibacillus sp. EC2-1 TaxID=3388665 RepID=UPI003BEEBB6C
MLRIGKAVIFDLDGVIINSQELYEESLRTFIQDLGVKDVDFTRLIGMTTTKALSCINETNVLPGTISSLTQAFQETYQTAFKQSLSEENLVEGVEQFILRLATSNKRLAVASSAARPKIEFVLDRFGLTQYFDCVVSGYEVKKSKPAPDVFLVSASKLNVSPIDCIVIEDSTNGIIGAKRAGMFCIGFRNPESRDQDLTGADCIIESFSQIDTME